LRLTEVVDGVRKAFAALMDLYAIRELVVVIVS
jgi:hypothetical protein